MLVAPGPLVTIATPGPTGHLRIALGHVARSLLVSHEDVADRGVENRVVHGQDRTAGQPEDDLDALALEALDQCLRSGESHFRAPRSGSHGIRGLDSVRASFDPLGKAGRNSNDLPEGRSYAPAAFVRGYAAVPPSTTRISRVGRLCVIARQVCHDLAGRANNPGQGPALRAYGSVTAPRSAPVTRRAYLASTPVV